MINKLLIWFIYNDMDLFNVKLKFMIYIIFDVVDIFVVFIFFSGWVEIWYWLYSMWNLGGDWCSKYCGNV